MQAKWNREPKSYPIPLNLFTYHFILSNQRTPNGVSDVVDDTGPFVNGALRGACGASGQYCKISKETSMTSSFHCEPLMKVLVVPLAGTLASSAGISVLFMADSAFFRVFGL